MYLACKLHIGRVLTNLPVSIMVYLIHRYYLSNSLRYLPTSYLSDPFSFLSSKTKILV